MLQIIEPTELFKVKCATPHTTHCLANGDIMISCMADGPELNGRGSYVVIDGESFTVKGTYQQSEEDIPQFG